MRVAVIGSRNLEIQNLENLSVEEISLIGPKKPVVFKFDQEMPRMVPEAVISTTESFLQASVKDQMKILGTIFNTYIVIEYDNAVFFIDQHAGHERLLFDRLVKAVNEGKIATQNLLAPYTFKAGARESQSIDMMLDNLQNMGFEISRQNQDYIITGVPYLLADIDISKFVDDLVRESVNLEKKTSDFIHEKLCQSACKHAIKAGDSISKDECAYLIEEVRKGVMLCPHGRPITLILKKGDFEKMFKRIV